MGYDGTVAINLERIMRHLIKLVTVQPFRQFYTVETELRTLCGAYYSPQSPAEVGLRIDLITHRSIIRHVDEICPDCLKSAQPDIARMFDDACNL